MENRIKYYQKQHPNVSNYSKNKEKQYGKISNKTKTQKKDQQKEYQFAKKPWKQIGKYQTIPIP